MFKVGCFTFLSAAYSSGNCIGILVSLLARRYCVPFSALLILCSIGSVFVSNSVFAAQTLRFIQTHAGSRDNKIQVYYNGPLRYIGHAPKTRSKSVTVSLLESNNASASSRFSAVQNPTEVLSWPPTQRTPLKEVQFSRSSTGTHTITFRFTRSIDFSIHQDDQNSITLSIIKPASTASKTRPDHLASTQNKFKSNTINAKAKRNFLYVINLESSFAKQRLPYLPDISGIDNYHVYSSRYRKNGKTRYRIRLGFFEHRNEARKLLRQLAKFFPGAWIDLVQPEEIETVNAWATGTLASPASTAQTIGKSTPATKTPLQRTSLSKKTPPNRSNSTDKAQSTRQDNSAALLLSAKQEITNRSYRPAIRILHKLLALPPTPQHADAQELLGLAHERKGQLAHAKAEYKYYLQQYPQAEGAIRVRQRLNAILTARSEPKQSLRSSSSTDHSEKPKWEWLGSFSEYYSYDVNTTDIVGDIPRSILNTDLDISSRLRGEHYDLRTRLTANQQHDFEDKDDANDFRVRNLYFEATSRDRSFSTRIGRQSPGSGGVLGRFDGAYLSYEYLPMWRVEATVGYPVRLSQSNSPETNEYFYGLNLNYGTFADFWDVSFFAVNQFIDNITERSAIGTELRYSAPNQSLFTLVDYDTLYKELNTALMIATWNIPQLLSFSVVVDHRKSPSLATSNALQAGVSASPTEPPVETIEELLDIIDERTIRELARTSTPEYNSATIAATITTSEHIQIGGDINVANLKGTPGLVDNTIPEENTPQVERPFVIDGTGDEVYMTLQLIGLDLFTANDLSIIALRFSNSNDSDRVGISIRSRHSLDNAWRIDPRISVVQQVRSDDTEILTTRPEIRIEYFPRKHLQFEASLGYEKSDYSGSQVDNSDEESLFTTLGLIYDF